MVAFIQDPDLLPRILIAYEGGIVRALSDLNWRKDKVGQPNGAKLLARVIRRMGGMHVLWPVIRAAGGPGSGNFGHAGRPGEVGGSAGDTAASLTRKLRDFGIDVAIEDHPIAIQAAVAVHSVLKEMHSRGYKMPDEVTVNRVPGGPGAADTVSGQTSLHTPDANSWSTATTRTLSISIPDTIPASLKLDDVVRASFGKDPNAFAVRSMRDIVIHEMGHVQVASSLEGMDWDALGRGWAGRWKNGAEIAKGVSDYASKNPDEFVAESFTRMYRGETLSSDVMKMYRDLKDPVVK